MEMSGNGSRIKRKRIRDIVFKALGSRSMVDVVKGDRSEEVRRLYSWAVKQLNVEEGRKKMPSWRRRKIRNAKVRSKN